MRILKGMWIVSQLINKLYSPSHKLCVWVFFKLRQNTYHISKKIWVLKKGIPWSRWLTEVYQPGDKMQEAWAGTKRLHGYKTLKPILPVSPVKEKETLAHRVEDCSWGGWGGAVKGSVAAEFLKRIQPHR